MASNEKKPANIINMKKKEQKPIKKILLSAGAIILFFFAAFAFLFLPAMVRSPDTLPPFGKYNGKPIEYAAGTYFANMVEYYSKQMTDAGQEINDTTYFSVLNAAFGSTVIRMAFTDAVNDSGYIVPQNLIDRSLLPFFSDANDVYSPRIFRETPENTKVMLRKEVSEDLVYQRYYDDVFGDSRTAGAADVLYGLKQSDAEIPFIAEMNKNQRSFEIAAFPVTTLPDGQLSAFGRENSELFVRYDMSVITAGTEQEAKKILSRLTKNEILFDDAVSGLSSKIYSDEAGKLSGNFYYQLKNMINSAEGFDAVTSLAEGAVSEAVPTGSGWSIFRMDGPAVQPDFNDQAMLGNVHTYMSMYETGKIEDYYTSLANDFADAAIKDGFDAACVAFDIRKTVTTPFPLNYGNNSLINTIPTSAYSVLNGAQTNSNFLRTAFSLHPNEISSPVVLGKNVLVLRLAEETAADPAVAETLAIMYPSYTTEFDMMSLENFIMSGKQLENNLMQVYFSHILSPR